MKPTACAALLDGRRTVKRVVEVGIGRRPAVASALSAAGVAVTATDIEPQETPTGVRFALDDVTAPDPAVYAGADLIYALNLPPELHQPARAVARRHDAGFAFTTLGGDLPAIPVQTETHADVTLFWGRELDAPPTRDPGSPAPPVSRPLHDRADSESP